MLQDGSAVKTSGKLPQFRSLSLVSLGSNQSSVVGDARETVLEAIKRLVTAGGVIRSQSALFRTPAFPAGAGPDFVNAAIALDADWDAETVLSHLHRIEGELGRKRTRRWGQRTLDLDLLACGDAVLPDADTVRYWMNLPPELQAQVAPRELILPHPRIQDRAFVLGPLRQVAPDWKHPLLGRTTSEMWDALPKWDRDDVSELD